MEDLTGDWPTVASEISGVAAVIAGRYRVRARLGRGATKEVYLAYDERLDREVALALVVGAIGNPAAGARITREAQVTGRLGDHPNVITVYDTGEHEGIPYLVLRAMPGGSLADVLDRGRPSIADALRWGRELAAALAHAHAHAVVHRDVKPDNVWLAADGSAALGDFGIAHQLGLERLTAEGVVVGTVRYLSPEQIRGEEIGPASDLYALGVTLYELVTGSPPFAAKDATFVLTQHLTVAPEPPSRREPAVPAQLEKLILALLEKDAAQRPAAAADVAAALEAIAGRDRVPTEPVAPSTPRTDARRLVSVLAARADVSDPEALHGVFQRAASIIEQHGGTVERYLGDGLVGFFGLTESHEDDALRATRAAVELRDTTTELRVGIESGEVFLSAGPHGATVTTGSAITTAGRLAEGAAEGEILLGDRVRRAVGSDASVDAASGRLLELHPEQPALLRAVTTPFVGRARELDELRAAFARACQERTCRLVTIAGPPGIGKSRLAGEFLASAGDRATVLVGRCLAYGEGTTYRALADIVRGLGGDDPRDRLAQLMDGDEQAVRGILAAIGLSDEPAQPEETAWALRRLLERLAREQPVVVAVEDIHWAEPALLDLLDHVATLSAGAPLLLVCLTRPELLEQRPDWAAPQPNRLLLMLDALDGAQARELAARLGGAERADRIAARAEGNPLFVEQLVAVDDGRQTDELPASIHAVLAARIDRLEADERALLQHAAVEGRTFHAGALAVLQGHGDDARRVSARLVALARKGLIGGDQPEFAGQDAFRFNHVLIREAAYAGLPKAQRAELHARVAHWLAERQTAADEIVAFHLEQACLLAAELGRATTHERDLATRALERFDAAARAALTRADPATAAALLERGVALLDAGDPARAERLPALGAALFAAGRAEDARTVLDEAVLRAPGPLQAARARVEREFVRLEHEPGARAQPALQTADAALAVFDQAGDDAGRCRAWALRAQVAWTAGQVQRAEDAWRRAGECAAAAGDERALFETLGWRATAAVLGPTPVDAAIRQCEAARAVVQASPAATAWILNPLASLHAMRGDFALAQQFLDEADETLRELGSLIASVSHHGALVQLLAGRPELAEIPLQEGVAKLESMSDGGLLATTTAMLAQAVYAQGRTAEAERLCAVTADAAPGDDIVTNVIWRSVQAKVLAHGGECEQATAQALEAVALAARTDLLSHHGDAMLDLAEVHRLCARPGECTDAVHAALDLYDAKGNAAAAARARRMLGRDGSGAPGERAHPSGG
jgi:class 3 adenylate cyclase/tetratricopeptide (TPR) repeat protein